MLFTKAIFTVILSAGAVLGAPLEERAPNFFTPSAVWKYNVGTGAIFSTTTGEIAKSTDNKGQDVTTLVTFTYPAAVSGLKCQFAFFLNSGATLQGSHKIDVFTSLSPAPGPRSSWGPGNQRNIQLGRLTAELGAQATWDATYNAYLTKKTPCKAPGTEEGFELVGVYDNDYVAWDINLAGPRIIFS